MLVPLLGSTRAFVAPSTNARRVASPPRLTAAGPCESAGWPHLQGLLDELPVFTVANGDGQPLEYQTAADRKLAIFYTDVEAAMKQTEAAKVQFPDLGCDIITTGLGCAYKLSGEGAALIVPGVADLQGAGAPEGVNPMGQEVPLFACMELTREGDDGAKVPLFMSYADCAEAVAEAPGGPLEVNAILSLQSIVEELVELEDPSSGEFKLVPPASSRQHVSSYVGQGVYMRKVEEGE